MACKLVGFTQIEDVLSKRGSFLYAASLAMAQFYRSIQNGQQQLSHHPMKFEVNPDTLVQYEITDTELFGAKILPDRHTPAGYICYGESVSLLGE